MISLPTRWTRQSELLKQLDSTDRDLFLALLAANSQQYYAKLQPYPSPALFYVRRSSTTTATEDDEQEYILKSALVTATTTTKTANRACYHCGGELAAWILIGGGYQQNDSWYGALLREALPLVLCELCFRVHVVGQPATTPIDDDDDDAFGCAAAAAGVAVLPALLRSVTIMRQLEIQRHLIGLRRRRQGRRFFELDNFLLHDELVALRGELQPSIHVRAHTGQVKILYSFSEDNSASLPTQRPQFLLTAPPSRQTGLRGVLGFNRETVVRIQQQQQQQEASLDVDRTVADFYWLHSQLLLHGGGSSNKSPPPVPHTLHVGFYSPVLLDVKLSSLERFLVQCCQDADWRRNKSLEAFFRPGFVLAKAVMETRQEADNEGGEGVLMKRRSPWPKAREFLSQCLSRTCQAEQRSAELADEFAAAVFEGSARSSTSKPTTTTNSGSATPAADLSGGLEQLVLARLVHAREQTAKWQAVMDYVKA